MCDCTKLENTVRQLEIEKKMLEAKVSVLNLQVENETKVKNLLFNQIDDLRAKLETQESIAKIEKGEISRDEELERVWTEYKHSSETLNRLSNELPRYLNTALNYEHQEKIEIDKKFKLLDENRKNYGETFITEFMAMFGRIRMMQIASLYLKHIEGIDQFPNPITNTTGYIQRLAFCDQAIGTYHTLGFLLDRANHLVELPAIIANQILHECITNGKPSQKTVARLGKQFIRKQFGKNIKAATIVKHMTLWQGFMSSELSQEQYVENYTYEHPEIKETLSVKTLRNAKETYRKIEAMSTNIMLPFDGIFLDLYA